MSIIISWPILLPILCSAILVSSYEIETPCGIAYINHSCLQELVESDAIQRLKDIDQSGPWAYYDYCLFFSRYEHSLGVLALIQKAKGALDEQIAALAHDASHSSFSHTIDGLFKSESHNRSYQDIVHLEFLKHCTISLIINKYGLTVDDIDPDREQFKALERPLPNLCADRIEYTIHTALLFDLISPCHAKEMIEKLEFIDSEWVFTSREAAQQFANFSLKFTKEFWGSPLNSAINDCFVRILEEALAENIIELDDIKYSTDTVILDKINQSNNPRIIRLIAYLSNIQDHFKLVAQASCPHCISVKPKFRGTDPLVMINNSLRPMHLSQIDPEFKETFLKTKEWCTQGYTIQVDW